MNKLWTKFVFVILAVALIAVAGAAQTKKKPVVKKVVTPGATDPQPVPSSTPTTTHKKNERPTATPDLIAKKPAAFTPVYFYEFSRPGFVVEKVLIEHDEAGKGTISFLKQDAEETISEPLEVTAATLEKIRTALTNLNFLDSTESYQYEKDYPHLGNITFTLKRDGRSRTAKFNWTTNKDAKILMDEYRKLSAQSVWTVEINTARENQPLLTPGLIDALDSYLGRNEISDPPHLLPFLTQLSTDERLPLIARNHLSRLIKQIEKELKK